MNLELLTTKEAALALGVPEYTVRILHSRGWVEPGGTRRRLTSYAPYGRRWSVVELAEVFRHWATSGLPLDQPA